MDAATGLDGSTAARWATLASNDMRLLSAGTPRWGTATKGCGGMHTEPGWAGPLETGPAGRGPV